MLYFIGDLVIGILCIFISIAVLIICIKEKELLPSFLSIVLFAVGIGMFKCSFQKHEKYVLEQHVPAIEVYRGNTNLLITYNDTIPVDSIVVLKNK